MNIPTQQSQQSQQSQQQNLQQLPGLSFVKVPKTAHQNMAHTAQHNNRRTTSKEVIPRDMKQELRTFIVREYGDPSRPNEVPTKLPSLQDIADAFNNEPGRDRKIFKSSLGRYLQEWRKDSNSAVLTEATPRTGRKTFMHDDEEEMLADLVRYMNVQHESVSAHDARSFARGLVSRERKMTLEDIDKMICKFSLDWVRDFLKRHNFKKKRQTTTRTVSHTKILKDGEKFFEELGEWAEEYYPDGVDPDFVLNMDEYFQKLSHQRTVTYIDADEDDVALKEDKLGFTSSITTTLSGKVLLLHLLWKGKRESSSAPAVNNDPFVLQTVRPESHFQNSESFKVWEDVMITRVKEMREERGESTESKPALWILDVATQHKVSDEKLRQNNIHVIWVPESQTHYFQPADQWIIANIRAKFKIVMENRLAEKVRLLSRDLTPQDLAGLRCGRTLAERRNNIATAAVEAVKQINAATVEKSWHRTGIRRALLGGEDNDDNILYDALKQKLRDVNVEINLLVRDVDDDANEDNNNDDDDASDDDGDGDDENSNDGAADDEAEETAEDKLARLTAEKAAREARENRPGRAVLLPSAVKKPKSADGKKEIARRLAEEFGEANEDESSDEDPAPAPASATQQPTKRGRKSNASKLAAAVALGTQTEVTKTGADGTKRVVKMAQASMLSFMSQRPKPQAPARRERENSEAPVAADAAPQQAPMMMMMMTMTKPPFPAELKVQPGDSEAVVEQKGKEAEKRGFSFSDIYDMDQFDTSYDPMDEAMN